MKKTFKREKERISLTYDQLHNSTKMYKYLDKAIDAWIVYNNSGGKIDDGSTRWYNLLEKTANNEAIKKGYACIIDCGVGLYPTFEVIHSESKKSYTEYDIEGFFRRINGFWD